MRLLLSCALAAASGLAPPPATAQDWTAPWRISGSLSAAHESYRNRGDPALGLYFSEGPQSHVELDATAERRLSPFARLRLDVFGLLNRSDYRSDEQGLLVEEFTLLWEKGDGPLPLRAELGDHFGFFTFRTLQRSLKGAQIEFQPHGQRGGFKDSLILLAGTPAGSQRDFSPGRELYAGASWQRYAPSGAAHGLSIVRNDRAGRRGAGVEPAGQTVASVAGLQPLEAFGQRIELEGEFAYLRGDGDGTTGVFRNRDDLGVYAQLSGRSHSLPLFYSARYERYGEHFSPRGAVTTPDRQTAEGRAAWQFDAGPRLGLRAVNVQTALESANPLDSRTLGIDLAGPLDWPLVRRLSFDLDAFAQDVRSRDRSTDRLIRSARADVSTRLLDGDWSARLGLFAQSVRNRRSGSSSSTTREARLRLLRSFVTGDVYPYVGPQMLVRRVRGGGRDSVELGPGLVVGASGSNFSLDSYWVRLRQDRRRAGSVDFTTDSLGFFLTWFGGNHYLELDGSLDVLDPDPGRAGSSMRVGARYTYFFDKPARSTGAVDSSAHAVPAAAGAGLDLLALTPGLPLALSQAELDRAGLGEGVELGRTLLYTRPLFDSLPQGQRLYLLHDGDTLERVVLVVDADDAGGVQSAETTFERLRRALLTRYGRPRRVIEEGRFDDELEAALRAGRFVRTVDWQRGETTLRLGIPRRPDGRVRIEVHVGRDLGPARSGRWSVEALG